MLKGLYPPPPNCIDSRLDRPLYAAALRRIRERCTMPDEAGALFGSCVGFHVNTPTESVGCIPYSAEVFSHLFEVPRASVEAVLAELVALGVLEIRSYAMPDGVCSEHIYLGPRLGDFPDPPLEGRVRVS